MKIIFFGLGIPDIKLNSMFCKDYGSKVFNTDYIGLRIILSIIKQFDGEITYSKEENDCYSFVM